jgi:CheY-like chemotaxis protein/anti-sigma regulatory factor (Ser/Thr protein kinase)
VQTVLVVEDDRTTRHLIRGLLEKDGFSVHVAGDGREALTQLDQHEFDLLMIDVWMPGMDGIELLGRLRAERRRPRIVVITADDTPATLLRIVREQAFHVIRKPVHERTLLEIARTALAAPSEPRPIEVVSATPHWVELLVPCEIEAAERIESILGKLDADLPAGVRETVGQAFNELLRNAIEWGGELDPTRMVRISYVRARRALFYRIADPGKGFRLDQLAHSAVGNPDDRPFDHVQVREELGIRAGGFGILMARALVDELVYNESHNEVLFVKYLD